jgi:hypothetical protein
LNVKHAVGPLGGMVNFDPMKTLRVETPDRWRDWLAEHHASETLARLARRAPRVGV